MRAYGMNSDLCLDKAFYRNSGFPSFLESEQKLYFIIIKNDNIIVFDMKPREESNQQDQKERAGLVMHPERLQIIGVLTGKKLTPGQIAKKLSTISQAGLYRHLKRLEEGGLIEVVETHKVRGTLEKVYTCSSPEKAHFSEEDVRDMSPDMQHNLFTAFIANLYNQFLRVHRVAEETPEVLGKAGYQILPLDMKPEEFHSFQKDLSALLEQYNSTDADSASERYYLSLTLFPEVSHGYES